MLSTHQHATVNEVDGLQGLKNEGNLEVGDGGQQVQVSVEDALASSMISEEQVQVGVDVVERSTIDVARIEMDLAKTIFNIVEQEIVILAPMLEQKNANKVVDIDQGDILNFIYYN